MKITREINPNIFREYDIRGIYKEDLTEDTAYTIGRAFGSYVKNKNIVIVGHDNRDSYKELFPALIKGLTDSGINVINIGCVTTPMHNFSKIFCNVEAGIMLTASHNPQKYNGFKMSVLKTEGLYGKELKKFQKYLENYDFCDGNGTVFDLDITKDYFSALKKGINLGKRKIKVVFDLGNGTGGLFIKDILDMFDIDYKLLYEESDSSFPNHIPDPAEEKNMKALSKKVQELNYDIGLAVDGDCDRCGVVLENGQYISSDLMMLIFYRNLALDMPVKKAIFDVKCSKTLIDEIEKLGLEPIMFRTGGVYLRQEVHNLNLAFGGEYSGHVVFNDRYLGYDDGIYAALRFIEILSHSNKKASSLLENINKYYSTEEIKILVSDDEKFDIIKRMENYVKTKKYDYSDLDGIRVNFEDGWALVRASNSGPNIILRFEAKSEERLEEIKQEFMKKLRLIMSSTVKNIHNDAKKNEIAKTVIMPGDPLRAKYIAEKYLDDYTLVNKTRNMYAYTGYYKKHPVTVMAHGMGMPSIGIYAYELYNTYDVDKIIRIGSCGSYDQNLEMFDIILSEAVFSESNFALTFNNENCHYAYPSKDLNDKIEKTALKLNTKIIKGNTVCSDVFDAYMMDYNKFFERIPKHHRPLAAEMESFALFYIAEVLGKKAACLMSVVDFVNSSKSVDSSKRQTGLDKMIELALESIL